MNATNKKLLQGVKNVLNLDEFRGVEKQPLAAALQAKQDRIDLVQNHINQYLSDRESPAVAAAMVFLDSKGNVGVAAAGIEPEMAAQIATQLRSLAAKVDRHRFSPRSKKSRQRGIASFLSITTLGFVAATYLNQIAWVDAALMISAQAITVWLSARRDN